MPYLQQTPTSHTTPVLRSRALVLGVALLVCAVGCIRSILATHYDGGVGR